MLTLPHDLNTRINKDVILQHIRHAQNAELHARFIVISNYFVFIEK